MNYFLEAICLKNHDDIVREIRILTYQGNANDLQQKQQLILAARFKQLYPLCENINENVFLVSVFNWLVEQPEPHANEIATAVWMYYLDENIPAGIRPHDFIGLGVHYIGAPAKLAGFISFLFKRGISIEELVRSGVLHQLFAIEVVLSIDNIKATYDLIFPAETQHDIKNYLTRMPGSIGAFLNYPEDNAPCRYSSFNLMGGKFSHTHKISVPEHRIYSSILFSSSETIRKLYTLFGWTLITTLTPGIEFFDLMPIVFEHDFEKFVEHFSEKALRGELPFELTQKLLLHLAIYLKNDKKITQDLINRYPFYLCVLKYTSFLPSHLECKNALEALLQLKNIEVSIIFFFIELNLFFEKQGHLPEQTQRLGEMIVKKFVSSPDFFSVEEIQLITTFKNIKSLLKEKIKKIKQQLLELILAFSAESTDFYSVLVYWESHQAEIKSYYELNQRLEKEIEYPKTIYDLKSWMLQSAWSISEIAHFDFGYWLNKFALSEACSRELLQRTLQETLLDVLDEGFIFYALEWLKKNDFDLMAFFQSPFGNDKALFQKAIIYSNAFLFETAVTHLQWDPAVIYLTMIEMLESKNFDYVQCMLPIFKELPDLKLSMRKLYFKSPERHQPWDNNHLSILFSKILSIPETVALLYDDIDLFRTLLVTALKAKDLRMIYCVFNSLFEITTESVFVVLFGEFKEAIDFLPSCFSQLNCYPHMKALQWIARFDINIDMPEATDSDDDVKLLLSENKFQSNKEVVMEGDQIDVPVRTIPWDYSHFHYLSQNEYMRYAFNSRQVAYVVEPLNRRQTQYTTLHQYPREMFVKPEGFLAEGNAAPEVVPIEKMRAIEHPSGYRCVMGEHNNTKMHSKRIYHFSISFDGVEEPYEFYPLSPLTQDNPVMPDRIVRKFADTPEGIALNDMPLITKTGDDIVIRREDVIEREKMSRGISQNAVMGASGVEIYKKCLLDYGDRLSAVLYNQLNLAANVLHLRTLQSMDRRGIFVSQEDRKGAHVHRQRRPELLHREANVLTNLNKDPQRKDNLGAASLYHNTMMMISERILKWFAKNVPEAECRFNCRYEMFLDTEVIERIFFFAVITFGNVVARIRQEINVFETNPQYVKASDLAGLCATMVQLMNRAVPVMRERVKILPSHSGYSAPQTTLFQIKRERDEDNLTREALLQPRAA